MPLTEEQRQAIRDEEFFRNEVRKELAGQKGPPGFLERCSSFLETKAGFWLLTTALAGLTATGFTSWQRYIDREEIAQREAAERARRDMETVLKLGPMLTSDKRTSKFGTPATAADTGERPWRNDRADGWRCAV